MMDSADLLILALSLALSGVVTGLVAGLLGVGGGAVIVPILYDTYRLIGVAELHIYHLAIGTSLAIIIPASIRSFLAHYRYGAVNLDLLKQWSLPVLVGVLIGTLATNWLSGDFLRRIFGLCALCIALSLLVPRAQLQQIDSAPSAMWVRSSGVIIGSLSTVMGIGGGSLGNIFQSIFGSSMARAVATSSGLGVLISTPAMLGLTYAGWGEQGMPVGTVGYVNWVAVAIILPLTLAMTPLGARIAHNISEKRLKQCFGVFLLIVSCRFLYPI